MIPRVIALPSVKYCGRVETDVLGRARRVASEPFAKITIDPEHYAAGEARKKRPVFERLLSLSATYFQGCAMAAMGEWRDDVGRSKLTSVSLERAVR